MNTNTAKQMTSPQPDRNVGDYRLLLNRLHKAPLDESGAVFVGQALTRAHLLDYLDTDSMLQVAIIAQQHGLIEQSLAVYERLNVKFPECAEGWQQHLEVLSLLGKRKKMLQVRARGAGHFTTEQIKNWPGGQSPGDSGDNTQTTTDVTAPFQELRREEEQIRLFMDLFKGREDAFARQWVNPQEEKQGYVPVRHSLQFSDIKDHLEGRRTYGIYLLDHESMVHTGVIDMDLVKGLRGTERAKKEKAAIRREALYLHKRIAGLAGEAGLCCLAEVSGGKGYHFWFPVREKVAAGAMRQALLSLIGKLEEDVQCFTLEVFPKQDKLTGKGFGNLVKLPLGIHRGSGKPSSFVLAADRSRNSQFELLAGLRPTPPERIIQRADLHKNAAVLVHPRHAAWAEEYPELAQLETNCSLLGQLMATLRSAKELSLREEKIILGTLGHLPRAGLLIHYLFAKLPEYNRPLLDYKISRIRGTVLGCKRIHSLLEQGSDLPCRFKSTGYPHPLRHLQDFSEELEPKSEKVENLQDALTCLKTAIIQVERFM